MLASAQTFPATLPEWACIYQVTVLRNLTSWNHAKVTGTFPKGLRYFSMATYDQHGMPLDGLTDHELIATTGTNPYAYRDTHQPLPEGEAGTFEVYITLDGKVPNLPANQMAVLGQNPDAEALAACDTSPNGGCVSVIIFRLYHVGDGFEPFDLSTYEDPTVAWGNVPPAKQLYGNDSAGWKEMPLCDRSTQDLMTHGFAQRTIKMLTPIRYELPDHEAAKNVNGKAFFVPADDREGQFGNANSTYLLAGSYYEAKPEGPVYLLGHITGRMPYTPTGGLMRGPRYVDVPADYDVRYFGFSTVDLAGGKPTLDSVEDVDMEAFYTQNGAFPWTERNYSIITGPNKDIATECGLFQASESLFLSTTTSAYWQNKIPSGDPILPLPTYIAYVQRYMLASPNHTDSYLGSAANVKSADWVSKTCVALDNEAAKGKKTDTHSTCYNPEWVADKMKENVATIQYYLCDVDAPKGQRLQPFGRTFDKKDGLAR
jgi:hypothetical protein